MKSIIFRIACLKGSVDYQLPYEEYLSRNETNENRIVDILHRVVVQEHKRPILHRTTTMNSVRANFSLIGNRIFSLSV